MPEPDIDVIAVGAHPDDVEIGCGGTLARLVEQGHRVAIVDLTDGEPTPGSSGPDQRRAESLEAAKTLGVASRLTLDLPNRRLFDGFDARVKLATVFRRLRPRLVLCLGAATPTASPDHYQAMLISEAAVFYSKLSKWDRQFDGLPPHRISGLMHYYLAFRSLAPPAAGAIVHDISETLEKKMAAIRAYRSQFPPSREHLLKRIRVYSRQQGMAAGFEAGEVLAQSVALGAQDLMGLVFRPPG